MAKKYNSVCGVNASINHNKLDGSDVTGADIRKAILKRLACMDDSDLQEGALEDTTDEALDVCEPKAFPTPYETYIEVTADYTTGEPIASLRDYGTGACIREATADTPELAVMLLREDYSAQDKNPSRWGDVDSGLLDQQMTTLSDLVSNPSSCLSRGDKTVLEGALNLLERISDEIRDEGISAGSDTTKLMIEALVKASGHFLTSYMSVDLIAGELEIHGSEYKDLYEDSEVIREFLEQNPTEKNELEPEESIWEQIVSMAETMVEFKTNKQ